MLRVGVTGNIGSGKTIVCKAFAQLGVPVYLADEAAKKLMEDDAALRQSISAAFGTAMYAGNRLQRHLLAAEVFNNPEKLARLNAMVHPVVIAHGLAWMKGQTTSYAIKEAAIFFESGTAGDVDYMIGVEAPDTLRLHRAMQRDGSTREEVKARMQRQLDQNIKMKLCDAVIVNDDRQALLPQILSLHAHLQQVSAAHASTDQLQ